MSGLLSLLGLGPGSGGGAMGPGADTINFSNVNYCPSGICPQPQTPVNDSSVLPKINPPAFSTGPVRYYDGTLHYASTDLESAGFGMGWSQSRSWTNKNDYAPYNVNGTGTVDTQLPYLLSGGSGVALITDGNSATLFDFNGSTYQPRFFSQDKLTDNTGTQQFTLTDTSGDKLVFYDFTSSLPVGQQGQLQSVTDPFGNVTSVTARTATGAPAEIQRSATVNGTTTTESYVYSYLPSTDPNAGLLQNVTLRRQVNGGAWTNIRQVNYVYYVNGNNGNLGDLKSATIEDGAGNVLDTKYYRYYISNANGYVHGLKFVFEPDSYARATAAVGNIDTATDAQIQPYADLYFQYDASQRVTQEVVQGAGCSACDAGLGTFTFTYSASSNPAGFNSWSHKTIEILPDGNENIVYTNAYAEVMLKVYQDNTTGQQWLNYYQYDNQGRAILTAAPSAMSGFSEASPDLITTASGSDLNSSSGLVTQVDYYSTTTATTTTPGGAAGYQQDVLLRQGSAGTPVPQSQTQYIAASAGGTTTFLPATDTVYRNSDGTGAETTQYGYTFFSGTTQVQSKTITYPVISAAENGPGTADVETVFYNTDAQPIWSKDGDGFLTYTAFDPVTAAVTKTIRDVDTTRSADFSNLPAGWATPAGGGLHLVTTYTVDSLGRATQVTDRNGNITYIVFNDPNHEQRVFPGWNSATGTPTGPTQDYREDRPGSYTETLTMSATPHLTGGVPDGTEAISGLQTLARDYSNNAGQVVRQDAYFNLNGLTYSTAVGLGVLGTNYYETTLGYDHRGWLNRTVSPTGTIERTVHDGLGRPVSVWIGTNDTPASGFWSPSNPAGMVEVRAYGYDHGGVGDGDLTSVLEYPNGAGNSPPASATVPPAGTPPLPATPPSITVGGPGVRETDRYYDWQDRVVATKAGVAPIEDPTTNRALTFQVYDNLDEVVETDLYKGDGITISSTSGVPQPPLAQFLRARSMDAYDEQGRVYQAQTYSVDPTTGAVSAMALTTNTWRDHRGNVLEVAAPGGLVTKTQFDGAGRPAVVYTTDGGGGMSWAAASSVSSDVVLQQNEAQYDANGNAIEQITRQRFHDTTATGALGTPTTGVPARVSYVGMYYDAANRPTATVDVGTNGGTAWTRPTSVPARSDTVLVSSQSYDPAGRVQDETDPRGIVTDHQYDNLGEETQTVEAYTGGSPSAGSDKTTKYAYDGSGHLVTLTAVLPGGGQEQTQYVYGVSTTTGSAISSNDILGAVRYPDPSTGAASAAQQETYTVNALAQVTTAMDRNGTVHSYGYDDLGRLTSDTVTTLGAGVDGTVRRLGISYDAQGNPAVFTSYADPEGATILNQVQRQFNGLGQLSNEYQAHAGPVNPASTPQVQYAYNQMANGENNSRLVSLTYPNGRVLDYNYNSGLDDSISRLSSLSDSSGTLETYAYLGLSTVVLRAHPQTGIDLSYMKQPSESTGDAGDQYTGLDRFGRVVEQRWLNRATGTPTDDFKYGYDRDSNVLYKQNVVNAVFSELYHASGASNGYDQLNQLTAFARGALSDTNGDGVPDTVATPSETQSWNLDAMGNWSSVTTTGTTQTRTHNDQNQITAIGSHTLGYDNNGNLTTDANGQQFVYDAWNRLVEVKASSGTPVVQYGYDELSRRITETTTTPTTNSVTGMATQERKDLYYSAAWQVLEERDAGGLVTAQNVWSPVYIGALVLRDQASTTDGTLDQRLYVQQDANWNVTALVSAVGQVVERYLYDPYGTFQSLAADWTARSGSMFGWQYLFQGGRFDAVAGLYDFRHREYSPTLGRWTSVDPLGLRAGDPNTYRFVANTPASAVDPQGLWLNLITGAIGAVIGGAVGYWQSGTWKGAVVGAVAGGVGGFTLGAAGPAIATTFGGGWIGGAAAGGVSAVYGDLAGQAARVALGTQQSYNPVQTVTVGTIGCLTGGLLRPGNAANQLVSHWGGPIVPNIWVQIGKPSFFNWFSSGMIGEHSLGSAVTKVVPGWTLSFPTGWQVIKGLIGQRWYSP